MIAIVLIGSPQHNGITVMGRGGSVCLSHDERADIHARNDRNGTR
jgi:hypothetical protein